MKIFPSFDSRRLVEWQEKGFIKKIINRWYSFSDIQPEDHFLFWTANRIYQPSYISLETGLSYYGLIPEAVFRVTSATTIKTKMFESPFCSFSYRHLKPELFFGYQIMEWQGFPIKMAELEKLMLDYLYFNPNICGLEDFEGLRLNISIIQEKLDLQKFSEYLRSFENKALDRRTTQLLRHLNI